MFTALNADELRAGDKVIVADCIADLKQFVIDQDVDELYEVDDESSEYRFIVEDGVGIVRYALAYLVERKENCTNCKYANPHKNLLYCEDDNIPIYVGGEKLSVCDKYEPKTETEKPKQKEIDMNWNYVSEGKLPEKQEMGVSDRVVVAVKGYNVPDVGYYDYELEAWFVDNSRYPVPVYAWHYDKPPRVEE